MVPQLPVQWSHCPPTIPQQGAGSPFSLKTLGVIRPFAFFAISSFPAIRRDLQRLQESYGSPFLLTHSCSRLQKLLSEF